MPTNSARANNPISSGNKFQGEKRKNEKQPVVLKKDMSENYHVKT